jgi:multiple sugar transport system permease protein
MALMAYPVLYNIVISFLQYDNISRIRFAGLRNFRWFFQYDDSLQSLRVSTIYSLGTTTLSFLLALTMAHSLRRIRRLKGLFRTLLILPWVAPLVVSGLIWRWLFDKDMGLINYLLIFFRLIQQSIPFLSGRSSAMVSGIITSSWCYMPFLLVLIMAGLESIPDELYEAARMDGANNLQQFWHISLALNRQQMIIAYLIVLMFTFRTPDTFFSLTAGGPAKATYHTGIFLMETIYRYLNFGHAAAISAIVLLICLCFAFPGLYFGIMRRGGK